VIALSSNKYMGEANRVVMHAFTRLYLYLRVWIHENKGTCWNFCHLHVIFERVSKKVTSGVLVLVEVKIQQRELFALGMHNTSILKNNALEKLV
jgi:hypothetical protein